MKRTREPAMRGGQRRAWLAENEPAIRAYNERVEERGVFSDDWRRF